MSDAEIPAKMDCLKLCLIKKRDQLPQQIFALKTQNTKYE